ncbi:cytochrome P450 [Corynespora cassiicola Philippines]|uniref:Cytochrome P450 n=1 Tax=Corynespora cassiicola Philippines TaxID=1448308 RepID=A0A2T2NWE0_CORCC|nr:cytochrome P450 [Corynespora cassiicola Philippines]
MDSPLKTLLLLAPLSAITLHEIVLRRVEVDHLTIPIIAASSAAYWASVFRFGFSSTSLVFVAFCGTLSVWILLYRALWHPLRRFPGPSGARLSKWWTVKQTWDSGWGWHRVQQRLQREYGDYVRTGPREISIFDPAAIQPMLGFKSKTTKGPFYDVMEKSLHLNRDKAFHRQRRKVWDNAMKDSLSDYAPRIEEFTDQLLTRLREENGKSVQLLEYCTYYSYDVMAALAFGKPMGFVKGEQNDVAASILNTFTQGLTAMGLMYHMPWLMNALGILTSLAGPMKEWRDWSVKSMKERMELADAQPDLIEHLITNTPKDRSGLDLLYGESRLIISAGSETTSSALTIIFIHLAIHPHYMRALRKEYRDHASTYHCQRPLPLLDAIIQESMRLWPSVYFGPQRVTPPEGLQIGGMYIPGDTIIQMPPFAINRDTRNFVRPDDFIPERWTTQPELILNKSAFNPFSTGPYNCVGKGLANMELRSVVGRVINEFDIVLPEGFVADDYFKAIKEHFTAGPPKQAVKFVKVDD